MAKSNKQRARSITTIKKDLEEARQKYEKDRGSNCYLLLLGDSSIRGSLVDNVYDDLRTKNYDGKQLEVIVESSGGNIDAAYNLARLFRRYASENLTFVIPRWAKSAATLLACGGDSISMTPIAELGPLDPQITTTNPLEQRIEQFSPLHIESTLQLIRDEFKNGNARLADGLLQRLQFPLTLGSFKKLLELGYGYVVKLLSSRMFQDDNETPQKIAKRLTSGYADHSWCITIDEAIELGLNVVELEGTTLDIVWRIHNLAREKAKKLEEMNRAKTHRELKDIPADVLERITADPSPRSTGSITEPVSESK